MKITLCNRLNIKQQKTKNWGTVNTARKITFSSETGIVM